MTRIYDAIVKAGGAPQPQSSPNPLVLPGKTLPKSLEIKLLALYARIETMLADAPGGRVVEFTGIGSGHDCSKIVYEFARLVAYRRNKRVLLMGASPVPYVRGDFGGPGHALEASRSAEAGATADDDDDPFPEALEAGSDDSRTNPNAETDEARDLVTSVERTTPAERFGGMLDTFRERFDLVVIDAPSPDGALDGVTLSHVVDGVVIVVESGKTRWQVVQNAIDEVRARGGRVLGVAINKRRFYVPDFLYRRLF